MRRSSTPKWLALIGPLMFGFSTPACPDGAVDLTLELSDASGGGCQSDGGLARPFATGARLDIDAKHGGATLDVTDVTLSDPAIWTLEAVTNPVELRAAAAGVSDITVRSAGGRVATATLEVADVATATITPWNTIQPFNLTVDLDPGPTDLATQVAQGGYALLPDGQLRLQVTLRDADDRELGGYDVAAWTALPAASVTTSTPEARSNDLLVAHAGGAPTDVMLTTIGGGTFTLGLVDSGAATTMEAFVVETGQSVTALTVAAGTTYTLVGLVYDGQGRWLLGDDGQPFQVTLTNDGVVSVVPPPWSEGEDAITLDAAAQQILDDNRVFYLRGTTPGSTTITLGAAGVELELPVTVTP